MIAPFIQLLLGLAGGEVASRAGSALLRRLLQTGGESATKMLASGAASGLSKNVVGKAADKALAAATSGAPAWLSSRANVGTLARNAVEFGSSAGKMGLMTGGMLAAEHLMPGLGSNVDLDKGIEGWEMFQGQPNPGQGQQASALAYIQQDAQMKHLQRAIQEYMAQQREIGGMF